MHLRVADLLGDLRLGHVVDESHPQHQPLPLVQVGEGRVESDSALDQLEPLVLASDPLRRRRFLCVIAPRGPVERQGPAVVVGLEDLEHVVLVQLQAIGDLGHGRRVLQLLGQLGDRFVDVGHSVVEAARHAHGPDPVAEVAFQLAEDRRGGERRERNPAIGIEAIDRVEEPDVGNLEEVVEGLAGAAVAEREAFRKSHVAAHELLAGRLVAIVGEAAPELAFAGKALVGPRARCAGIVCVVLCSHGCAPNAALEPRSAVQR